MLEARMGAFAASGQARTFDFMAGDVGFVPFRHGPLHRKHRLDAAALPGGVQEQLLADVSLNQWLALTPPELVKAHLKLDPQTLAALHKEKFPVVPA
jgi:oxalate decarboxylase